MSSPINPKHYKQRGTIECIEVIEDWGLGYHLGNVLKYLYRAGLKTQDPLTDLQKALWYLSRFIDNIKAQRPVPNQGDLFSGPNKVS